jgi:hypothetical protein
VKTESAGGRFQAAKVESETLSVGTKSFDCARMSGEEVAGGKKSDAVRWWSPACPPGLIKSTSSTSLTEVVKAGDDWTKRPPFPS